MIRKALVVAVLVGTVLLVINQYDALLSNSELRVLQAIHTYCVPFVVFIAGQLSSKQE